MNNDTYHEEWALEGNFPGREKHGRDACVARVAMNGHPGLARSRDCAAQCFSRSLQGGIDGGPENSLPKPAPSDKAAALHE
ncbi:MAG TPA: hypothetical protein VK437_02825 [Steroidobacteraceae bacterium]|nr:hypothetical protein [Steroidobacteraceae bacterium]